MLHAVKTSQNEISSFCKRNQVRKLALFGSVLREDFNPESDVDVLVDFQKGAGVGLIALSGMELELAGLLGRRVELHTPSGLHPMFRDSVLKEAKVLYEQEG